MNDEIKNIDNELKKLPELVRNLIDELCGKKGGEHETNIKIVIEIAKDHGTFIKSVEGQSGATSKGFGCDSTKKVSLKIPSTCHKQRKKKPITKTKITVWLVGALTIIAAIAELINSFS
jgi:hypothetical protein